MESFDKSRWQEIAARCEATGVDGLELNFSCPHGHPERGMGAAMGQDPARVETVTRWVTDVVDIPVWAKMTPNITDIRVPARASLDGGANGVAAINTILSVIGVNTAIISPNGGSVGIGFAIPSKLAAPIIEDLRDDGLIERAWLGVQIQTVTEKIARSLGVEELSGALVAEVTPESPAANAGIEVGDVIVSFDSRPIDNARVLTHEVAAVKPSARVAMTVWRDGNEQSMTVEFGDPTSQGDLASASTAQSSMAGPRMGLSVAFLTPELRARFGISDELQGGVVVAINHQNEVARHALREGDVIVRIGAKAVAVPDDVSSEVQSAVKAERDSVLLLVGRRETTFFVAIPLV